MIVLAQVEPVGAYAMTSGRLWSLVAAGLGLIGVAFGAFTLFRSARRTGTGRVGSVVALVTGLAGAIVGGLVVAAAEGGPGTGYGIVGGYIAVVVGVAAMALGGFAMSRTRVTRR